MNFPRNQSNKFQFKGLFENEAKNRKNGGQKKKKAWSNGLNVKSNRKQWRWCATAMWVCLCVFVVLKYLCLPTIRISIEMWVYFMFSKSLRFSDQSEHWPFHLPLHLFPLRLVLMLLLRLLVMVAFLLEFYFKFHHSSTAGPAHIIHSIFSTELTCCVTNCVCLKMLQHCRSHYTRCTHYIIFYYLHAIFFNWTISTYSYFSNSFNIWWIIHGGFSTLFLCFAPSFASSHFCSYPHKNISNVI